MVLTSRSPSRHRAYWLLLRAALRGQMQYRANLCLNLVAGIAFQGIGLAFIWVVVSRFGNIGGWTGTELTFLYGMRLTSHGLWVIPGSQLFHLDTTIRTGEFDRYLVRPVGPLLQVLTRSVNLATFGDLLTGAAVLGYAVHALGLGDSGLRLLFLGAALLGGAMVEGSLQLAAAALSFRLLANQSLRILIDSIMNSFGGYPLKIFPDATRFCLTFVVPLAFVSYLPALVLTGRVAGHSAAFWCYCAAPLAGPLLLIAATLFWHRQLRHYSSTGT